MNNKGQFSIIAALLVAVILITTVIVTYSTIRSSPVQNQPPILNAIDETNLAIKQILGFTVGYYGSVLQITGNVSYANASATNYLQSGLQNIANMHPEWGTSLNLSRSALQAYWFASTSYSSGNLTVNYDLPGLGILGVNYQTSCKLGVQTINITTGQACLNITQDQNQPLVTLGKQNFNFYHYNNASSTWELVNPNTEPTAYANGTYYVDVPFGINPYSYVVQVQDQRGIIVVASSFNSYTAALTWNSTSAASTQTLYAHQETTTIGGSSYYLLKNSSADASGITLNASAGSTGRKLMGKFVYPLTGVSSVPASTWTTYYQAYTTASNMYSLDATGGYMKIGNGTPNWGSTAGTISFWVKWNTVANRPWGQADNMETKIPGSNLVLDWGATASITSTTSFVAGKWYFIAIVWNETAHTLLLYVGDQNSIPALDTQNTSWTTKVSTAGVTENDFMASKGGNQPLNGYGDDLRYWNVDRSLASIQGDYKAELTGSEPNLKSYFKLNNNFTDTGPNHNNGSGSGSYSFSSDVPFTTSSAVHANVDILIKASNGTVRQTVAQYVANSSNLAGSWSTLSGTYSWSNYTVVNQTDYLEIDYYVDVTSAGGGTAYLRIDDATLALSNQTRTTNILLPLNLYSLSRQETIVVELLQDGTMRWLGQNLVLTNSNSTLPFPPVPVKSIHVNETINGVNREVPFQIEDWSSAYHVPLGLTSNMSLFSGRTMLVFLATPSASKVMIWWNGSDTATQTPYAYTNRYFSDSPSSGRLSNGLTTLQFQSNFVVTSTVGSSSSTANFMRINTNSSGYGSPLSYVITSGTVRDIVHQEAEWSNGVTNPNCSDIYSDIVLTLPANATYYTYQLSLMFVQSQQNRTINYLCPVWLTSLTGQVQTENGTTNGLPNVSNASDLFYNYSASAWAHHWSQSISGTNGTGIMFTDNANQNLYLFDNIKGNQTGALGANSTPQTIQLLPVTRTTVSFNQTLDPRMQDIIWYGAIATFNATTTPIYNNTDQTGLWIIVEYPPTVAVTGENNQLS
ncbi:MAG: hypothetical protein ABSB28_00345 [Candidatus Bathyarchaeia archaeon]